MDKNESELVCGLKEGSEACFHRIYELYMPRLYKFALGMVKSEILADDIVQDTFVYIWENREQIHVDKPFKSYLFTISYHNVIREMRRQVRNPLVGDWLAVKNEYADSMGADNRLGFDEFVERLQKAKEKLTPRQREIFEMRYEQGLPPAEIIKILGTSNQTVRNQLAVAMKIMRSELKIYSVLFAYYCTF